jgi:hypothetical protein
MKELGGEIGKLPPKACKPLSLSLLNLFVIYSVLSSDLLESSSPTSG